MPCFYWFQSLSFLSSSATFKDTQHHMEAGGLIVQIFHTNIHLLNLLLCTSPETFRLADSRGHRILSAAWGNNHPFLWDMPSFCADILWLPYAWEMDPPFYRSGSSWGKHQWADLEKVYISEPMLLTLCQFLFEEDIVSLFLLK